MDASFGDNFGGDIDMCQCGRHGHDSGIMTGGSTLQCGKVCSAWHYLSVIVS